MVPSAIAILRRFKTEWAALPQPEPILASCREVGHTAWHARMLTPVTSI
jgi:hypothetical protein